MEQLNWEDVVDALKSLLPDDAYALVVIVEEELFGDGVEGQLLGRAAGSDRVCVCSTASLRDGTDTVDTHMELLHLLNTAVHEVLHIFSLDHCSFYLCTMNANTSPMASEDGDGDGQQLDSPVCLCPICLRKLQYDIGFDISHRYKALHKFCERHKFIHQQKWLRKMLQLMQVSS